MSTRKKCFASILLSACLMFAMCVPAVAFAEETSGGETGGEATTTTVTTAEEFVAAIQAGGTVTLGADITFHDTVVLGGDVVLDLNGHTLKYEYNETSVGSGTTYKTYAGLYGTYEVDNRYNLTIKDTSASGTGVFESNRYALYGYFADVQIFGGTFKCDSYAPICIYQFTKLVMSDAVLEYPEEQTVRLSYGPSTDTGVAITDSTFGGKLTVSSKDAMTITGNTVISGAAELSATSGVTLSGNTQFLDGFTMKSDCTIEDNVYVTASKGTSGSYSSKISFTGDGNVTINGGTFEVADRHFINCSGTSNQPYSKQFIINGGTFILDSTGDWDIGRFYYCKTPVINGGVFKTNGTSLSFAAAWNAGSAVEFNGGYFSAPLRQSTNADNTTPTFRFPSGFAMSTDTLGNLTGDTGEYADYYWITKNSKVTYDVNHSDSDSSNTKTYTGVSYTTYDSNSMLASSNTQSYTVYNPSVPYRVGDHSFKGWNTLNNAGEGFTVIDELSADATVYAIWDNAAPTYRVQYDLNGGTGNVPAFASNISNTETITSASSVGISRVDYSFSGWSTDQNATVADFAAPGKINVSTIAPDAKMVVDENGDSVYVITLYAVWTPKNVITFEKQSVLYTGKPIAYDATRNNDNVQDGFKLTYYSDSSYTKQIEPTDGGFIDAGYYYVIVERSEDATYASVYEKTSLYIKPLGNMNVNVWSYYELYDGKPHSVTVEVYGGPSDTSQITYEYGGYEEYTANPEYTSTELPTWTDVCSDNRVYVRVSAPGYITQTGWNTVTITKVDEVRIVFSESQEVVYDGMGHGLTIDEVDSVTQIRKYQRVDGKYQWVVTGYEYISITGAVPTLTYYTDEAYTDSLEGEPVDAGTYYVKAVLEGTKNYKAGEATATLTINKADNTLAFDENAVQKHINDKSFTPVLTGYTEGVTFTSSNAGVATVSEDGTVTITGVGETTITATVEESTNYNAATATFTLTVTDHEYNTAAWNTDDANHWHTCTICGAKVGEETHEVSEAWTTDETNHWHVCSVCGKTSDAAAHTYGEWEVTKNPTETSTGEKQHTCSVCGYREVEELPVISASDVQTKIVQNNLEQVPDGLQSTKFDTVDNIENELIRVATENHSGYTVENTVVYDVQLQISTDGGETWFEATEENFPSGGLTVVLPYPEGIDKETHDFVVTHMFTVTSSVLGTTAGNTETFTTFDDLDAKTATKLNDGIQVTLTGLSPVSISWKSSSLKVEKVVDDSNGYAPADQEFEFTFKLTGTEDKDVLNREYSYTSPADGSSSTIASGGTFTLKAGETIAITGLPLDVGYEITENEKSGWTSTAVGNTGTVSTDSVATFTSTYAASTDVNPVSLKVTKTLFGRAMNQGEFTFQIRPNAEGSTPLCTATSPAAQNAEQAFIAFDKSADKENGVSYSFACFDTTLLNKAVEEGYATRKVDEQSGLATWELNYVVEETIDPTTSPKVTYGVDQHNVTVTVKDAGDGTLQASINSSNSTCNFVNFYTPESTTVTVKGSSVLEGRDQKVGEFEFSLTPADDVTKIAVANNSVIVGADTAKNDGDGCWTFGNVEFTHAGTYTFAIAQVPGSAAGVEYDATTYTVVVTVTDDTKGALTAEVTSEVPEGGYVFTNTYAKGAVATVSLTGTTTLENGYLNTGDFTFALQGEGMEEPLTASNGLGGFDTDAFGFTLSYDLTDVAGVEPDQNGVRTIDFTYTVSEVVPPEANRMQGVTYDETASYTVVVRLTDDGKGSLSAAVVDPAPTVAFVNRYQATEATRPVQLEALATLSGRAVNPAEFSFEAVLVNGDGSVAEKPSATATNATADQVAAGADAGSVAFSPIRYENTVLNDVPWNEEGTRSATFTYLIREVDTGLNGVDYDESCYYARVVVTDDGSGVLSVADPVYTTAANEPVEMPTFANAYHIADDVYTPRATTSTDALEGTDLSVKVLSYEVLDCNGVGEPVLVASGTSGANGEVAFGKIDVTSTGTFTYKIRAVRSEEAGGIALDATEYYLELVVTDAGDGTYAMAGSYYYLAGDECVYLPQGEVPAFANRYDGGDATLNIEAVKVLEGRTLQSGEFSFVILDANGTVVSTGVNDEDGVVKFGSLQYVYHVESDSAQDAEEAQDVQDSEQQPEEGSAEQDATAPADSAEPGASDTATTEEDTPESEGSSEQDGAEPAGSTESVEPTESPESAEQVAPVESQESAEQPLTDAENEVATKDGGNEGFSATSSEGEEEAQVEASAVANLLEVELAYADDEDAEQLVFEDAPQSGIEPIVVSEVEPATDGESANEDEGAVTVISASIGEHWYTVREVVPLEATPRSDGSYTFRGVTYYPEVYQIAVSVTDNGEGLDAEVTEMRRIQGESHTNVSQIVFRNTYASSVPASVSLQAVTTLDGRAMANAEFCFEVRDAAGNLVTTATSTAAAAGEQGSVTFAPFSAPMAEGVYNYAITETLGGTTAAGVTYSDLLYTAQVTVVDNLDGTYGAQVAYLDAQGNAIQGLPAFKNTYQVAEGGVSVVLDGTMTLSGRDMKQGEFFVVVTDADGNTLTTGGVVGAANGEQAAIEFGRVRFAAPGTYDLLVSEYCGGTTFAGVSYDDAVFAVHVVVSDNGQGNLVAQVAYPEGGVAFQNTYAVQNPAKMQIIADKNLVGRDLEAGEFEFAITDASGVVVAQGVNAADGVVAFEPFTLESAGGFDYRICEVAGSVENVAYDDTVYTMHVDVTDDGLGNLVAEVTYPDGNPRFRNVYTEPEEPASESPSSASPSAPQAPASPQVPTTGDEGVGRLAVPLGLLGGAAVLAAGALLAKRRRNAA